MAKINTCLGIAAPVLQAVVGVPLQHLVPFLTRNVPVSLLLDLCEDPRLDEGSSTNHHTRARWTSRLQQNPLSPHRENN